MKDCLNWSDCAKQYCLGRLLPQIVAEIGRSLTCIAGVPVFDECLENTMVLMYLLGTHILIDFRQGNRDIEENTRNNIKILIFSILG